MCLNNSKEHPSCLTAHQKQQLKTSSLDILHLQRRRHGRPKQRKHKTKLLLVMLKRKIAMKNLKLYMQNQCIIEENERLRRKALVLLQENKVLLSHLQQLQINL